MSKKPHPRVAMLIGGEYKHAERLKAEHGITYHEDKIRLAIREGASSIAEIVASCERQLAQGRVARTRNAQAGRFGRTFALPGSNGLGRRVA